MPCGGEDAVRFDQTRLQKSEEIIELVGKGFGAEDFEFIPLALETDPSPEELRSIEIWVRDCSCRC